MSAPRYAENTEVPVERSRSEIESLLRRHGASAFFSASDENTGSAMIGFRLASRMFRIEVRRPTEADAPRKPAPAPLKVEGKPRTWESEYNRGLREARNTRAAREHAQAIERHEKGHAERSAKWVEAEERRRWRAQLLLIKAKLEMIATGTTTVEREFLADMLMPNGSTVGSQALPALARAYETGKMPSLLALGSGDT
jgi:hypothetical protein